MEEYKRIRIYEIAKQAGKTNKEVIDLFKSELNIIVKSHSSTVSQESANRIIAILTSPAKETATPVEKKPVVILKKAIKVIKEEEKPEVPVEAVSLEEHPAGARVEEEREKIMPTSTLTKTEVKESIETVDPEKPKPYIPRIQKFASSKLEPAVAETSAPTNLPTQTPEVQDTTHNQHKTLPHQGKNPVDYQNATKSFINSFKKRLSEDQISLKKPADPPPFKGKVKPGPYTPKAPSGGIKENLKSFDKALQKAAAKKHKKKPAKVEAVREVPTSIQLERSLTVLDLSEMLVASPAELIKKFIEFGAFVTLNQVVDVDIAKRVAEALGYTVIDYDVESSMVNNSLSESLFETLLEENDQLSIRAPIVTIMGHVDHGKTTLLDAIRETKHKLVDSEVGGITQSIGAYSVETSSDKKIVFIDTPGHEAFTTMRARGAQCTDIVILVVAADDGVKPQTIEAINHAKSANIPIVVAVNKIDKPDADPDRVINQLTEFGLIAEKLGGETIFVEVSALKRQNLDELLDLILLVAEMKKLEANPQGKVQGIILEASIDKGKGALAHALILNGTIKVGDLISVGLTSGRVRALIDDYGRRIDVAGPSTPVQILGLSDVPESGDLIDVCASEKELRMTVTDKNVRAKEGKSDILSSTPSSSTKTESGEVRLVVKADTQGSLEAVMKTLKQIDAGETRLNIVNAAIGQITETDVIFAYTAEAIVVGFNVKEDASVRKIADEKDVEIKYYDIVYKMQEDIEQILAGAAIDEYEEVKIGEIEVRQIFTIGKTMVVAGCYVLKGKAVRGEKAIILRKGKVLHTGTIDVLKRFKDDAKEVAENFECGISFSKFNDIQENDIIEVYTKEIKK